MPSHLHEAVIEIFQDRPDLIADLLRGPLGVAVPDYEKAQRSSADLTQIAPTEYRADAVFTLDRDGGPVLAVVVEVQLKIDARKRRSWPVYVATLHARLKCPVMLVVVCPDPGVAEWSAVPVDIGASCLVLTPRVLGPRQLPKVTDVHLARQNPELTVLSAMTHGRLPDPEPVFDALAAALEVVDHEHADLYTDLVFAVLPAAARVALEEFMGRLMERYEYQSEYARRYFSQGKAEGEAKGKAEGEARAVLAILDARGVEVPDDVRARITGCTDIAQLDAWIRRAATADKIQNLFD